MKILLTIALSILTTNIVFASDRNEAYNKICSNMYYDTQKATCMKAIKNYTYFQENLLKSCNDFYNDSDKIACLSNIGDKDYEAYEINHCNSLYNDTDKLTCLKENGQIRSTTNNCIKKEDLISNLQYMQYTMRQGDYRSVDNALTTLITNLNNCK